MADRTPPRRSVLRSLAALGTVGVAGCTTRAGPDSSGSHGTTEPETTEYEPERWWPRPRRDPANTARAPAEAAPAATDLSREWVYSTRNDGMQMPLVRGDTLVASAQSPNGDVFGLHSGTGDERWASRSQSLLASEPAIVSGSVFAVWSDRWTTVSIETVHGELSPPSVSVGSANLLRSIGETLVLGGNTSEGYEVLAAAPGESAPAWRVQLPFEWGDITDVARRDGVVYVAAVEYQRDTTSGPGSITAIDAQTGESIWDWEQEGDTSFVNLGVGRDQVYVTTAANVIALDREDGSPTWSLDRTIQGVYPAIDTDRVYVGDGTEFVARDKSSGEVVWETELNSRGFKPSIGGDTVYVTSRGVGDAPYTLRALDASTGEVLFRTAFGDDPLSAPVIAAGAVFVGVGNGTVQKFS